jgi:hypothetical protein
MVRENRPRGGPRLCNYWPAGGTLRPGKDVSSVALVFRYPLMTHSLPRARQIPLMNAYLAASLSMCGPHVCFLAVPYMWFGRRDKGSLQTVAPRAFCPRPTCSSSCIFPTPRPTISTVLSSGPYMTALSVTSTLIGEFPSGSQDPSVKGYTGPSRTSLVIWVCSQLRGSSTTAAPGVSPWPVAWGDTPPLL